MGRQLDDDETIEPGTENGRKRTSFSRLERRCGGNDLKEDLNDEPGGRKPETDGFLSIGTKKTKRRKAHQTMRNETQNIWGKTQ